MCQLSPYFLPAAPQLSVICKFADGAVCFIQLISEDIEENRSWYLSWWTLLVTSQPSSPASPAVQPMCNHLTVKPTFPLLPDKTALGDSVNNPTKVKFCYIHCCCHLYSQLFPQAFGEGFEEDIQHDLSRSWGEADCSESYSLPFLKRGISYPFPRVPLGTVAFLL